MCYLTGCTILQAHGYKSDYSFTITSSYFQSWPWGRNKYSEVKQSKSIESIAGDIKRKIKMRFFKDKKEGDALDASPRKKVDMSK